MYANKISLQTDTDREAEIACIHQISNQIWFDVYGASNYDIDVLLLNLSSNARYQYLRDIFEH